MLPTFELTIAPADWAALQAQFASGSDAEDWYPAIFRYGAETVSDARVRLRGGNSSCFTKMQLAISFNKVNDKGRFHRVRRIDLDHGGCRTMSERLALSYMRDLGIPAPCANHARLFVNGQYYGLFVNLEHENKDFLRRNFVEDDGNLYKYGQELKTNEEMGDTRDRDAYWQATDLASIAAMTDLHEAVREWAAEAVLPTRDNYWTDNWNYYLYHHPTRGFLFLPNDLDQAFAQGEGEEALPIYPAVLQHPADKVLADPAWRQTFKQEVAAAIDAYDLEVFDARIDRWWAQIRDAAAADPHFVETHGGVEWFRQRVHARRPYLDAWLAAHPAAAAEP